MLGGSLRAVLVALLLLGGLATLPSGSAQYPDGYDPSQYFTGPTADFNWTPLTPPAGMLVRFQDTSTPGTKGIQLYQWEWGDGTRMSQSRVSKVSYHIYAEPGTYTITHTVYERSGMSDVKTKEITILPALKPDLKLAREGSTVSVDASGSSSPNGEVLSYHWVWGDGTPNGTGPKATHRYATPGNYTVKLTITDSLQGEGYAQSLVELPDAPPAANFTVEPSPARIGEPVRFVDATRAGFYPIESRAWRVDGVEVATGAEASRVFEEPGWHNVTLLVTDARGATAEATRAIRVGAPPSASLNLSLDGRDLSATATAADPDGGALAFSWDWGDGAVPATGPAATHTFVAAGAYNVTLTVTDEDGLRTTVSRVVEIAGRAVVVAFDAQPQPARAGHEVRLLDGSVDPEGKPLARWSWELGDGGIAEGPEVVHIYALPGRYVVNLTVTDGEGGLTRASRALVVEAPPPATRPSTPATGAGPTPTTAQASTPAATTPGAGATTPATTPNEVTRASATPTAPGEPVNEAPGFGLAALALAAAAAVLVLRRRG